MKAIGAGYGRMGTMSIKAALEQLGYGPCLHMIDVIRNPELRHPFVDAIEGRDVDWNEAFEGWESTIDWPACSFWREHHETWPDLPVILNTRDKEAWYKSCMNSIHDAKEMAMKGELQPADDTPPPNPEVMKMINGIIWGGTFEGRFAADKEFAFRKFDEHYEAVRSTVPKEQILEFDATKDGWDPLCTFLGVDVPDEPFPHLNDTKSFRAQFGMPALESA
jgi:sulfotransferase family protein